MAGRGGKGSTGLRSFGARLVGDLTLTAGLGALMYSRRMCETSQSIDFLSSFIPDVLQRPPEKSIACERGY